MQIFVTFPLNTPWHYILPPLINWYKAGVWFLPVCHFFWCIWYPGKRLKSFLQNLRGVRQSGSWTNWHVSLSQTPIRAVLFLLLRLSSHSSAFMVPRANPVQGMRWSGNWLPDQVWKDPSPRRVVVAEYRSTQLLFPSHVSVLHHHR